MTRAEVSAVAAGCDAGGPFDLVSGRTFHGRRGGVENAFSYGIDYVLIDPTAPPPSHLRLFSRNRANLMALHDCDHGGAPHHGAGLAWVQEVLAARGVDPGGRILLLAQPRILGHVFNPVSFWLCHDPAGALCLVLAEVTNTFGDRHSYLCHHDDLRPIGPTDRVQAKKVFHVSPFQKIEGGYTFRFDIRAEKVGIWIDYAASDGQGLIATLTGARKPLKDRAILGAFLRRPFGARRVLGLIHWQALRLFFKGARFHSRPAPPVEDVTR